MWDCQAGHVVREASVSITASALFPRLRSFQSQLSEAWSDLRARAARPNGSDGFKYCEAVGAGAESGHQAAGQTAQRSAMTDSGGGRY